ncbi:MAG TPA: hypothetical protein VH867_01355 [Burkholderiales bacterium]|jgi:hypothetical protein
MRIRAPLLLCLLLAGCTYAVDESQLEANIVRPSNFKAGSGVIQWVGVLPGARAPGTGADAKGERPDRNLYRLYLLMDGDGFQTVDVDSSRFLAGEAVELTNDGRVVRVSGTTLNELVRGNR